ncbi:MAG: beta-lactamase family protein [Draconibacterium sp.]|nr:beta-lactamase family protein [Draconibacterium sp.]
MKIVYIIAFDLFINLCSIYNITAQTSTIQKDKLTELINSFIDVYNSGNSLEYKNWFVNSGLNKTEIENAVKSNLNAYHYIGKVKIRKTDIISPINVEAWVQTIAYDSWWKFSIVTDSTQNFRFRIIQPAGFSESFIHEGKLSESEIVSEIDSYCKRLADSNVFAGNVFIADKERVIYSKSFGNNSLGKPNNPEQQFGLASLGKMFTAVSVLQLIQNKQISLDSTAATYLPQFKNKIIAKEVTIRHLLTHTSGMGDFFENPDYQKNAANYKTTNDFLPILESDSLGFKPGSSWQYSNSGFILLALIIEKVTEKSFVNYIENNILKKSGMTMTEVGSGAGGGLSTVPDLFHFANALKSNKLLNEETTQLFFEYTVDGTWGLGSVHQKLGTEKIFGHGGDYEGVCTDFGMYLNSGHTAIVLSNTDPPFAHFISDKIKELIIRR